MSLHSLSDRPDYEDLVFGLSDFTRVARLIGLLMQGASFGPGSISLRSTEPPAASHPLRGNDPLAQEKDAA
jgi:hypothetical protein